LFLLCSYLLLKLIKQYVYLFVIGFEVLLWKIKVNLSISHKMSQKLYILSNSALLYIPILRITRQCGLHLKMQLGSRNFSMKRRNLICRPFNGTLSTDKYINAQENSSFIKYPHQISICLIYISITYNIPLL